MKGLINDTFYVSSFLLHVVVESMSKSAFLDMLKRSSDKGWTQETNEEQKRKVNVARLS